VPAYAGALGSFRPGLGAFLATEAAEPPEADEAGNRLIDSLLATVEQNIGLDWKEREPIQARLKVACKRVLVHFEVDAGKAEEIAGRLVAWLRVQVDSSGAANPAPSAAGGGPAS